MINPVIILGVNPTAIAACEVFLANEVTVFGFLTENNADMGKEIMGIPVLGELSDEELLNYIGPSCDAFIAQESAKAKKNLYDWLVEEKKRMPINAFAPNAYFSKNNQFGHGNLVLPGANVAGSAQIGNCCTIMHNAIIEAGAVLENFVHIGSGAVVCSGAHIGEGAFIGAGSVVVSGIDIGKNASVGAGSVVMAPVAKSKTVFGIPAEEIKL